ncbi:MAG TPA: ATP synthase F1 subunit epsilon [Bacteroidales bacterium]|jgi:F-type H+-transporting ATPase subunit epsilon|nr:ATP synthase F1 subunit epsilon [Bacteroidales bacterium]
MYCEIITPDKNVFSGEIKLIQVPGSTGSFEILKNHAPIISTLAEGSVKIVDKKGERHFFSIDGGVVEFKENHVIVLAETN